MDDYTEKLNKIKSTISVLKSDLNDKSKFNYNGEYNRTDHNYLDIPLQIEKNKEKTENNFNNCNNEYTYNLNTDESLTKTDYTNNNNNNNNNNCNNNLNVIYSSNTAKNIDNNHADCSHLETYPGTSADIKCTDETTSEIKFNNTPISNTFRRNTSNKEPESKEETLGYLKNLKEEMKKFTEFNFDFENLNKNKTPEFKETSKYNLNYQLNNENEYINNNNNTCTSAITTPYEYNCTYTLHNETNTNNIHNNSNMHVNKDNLYDKHYDSFSNSNYNNISNENPSNNNITKYNSNYESVNYSKISNPGKIDNLELNKKSELEFQIQQLKNQLEDLNRRNLYLEKKLSMDKGKPENPLIKITSNSDSDNFNINLIKEIMRILRVNQDNEIIPKLNMLMKNRKLEKINQEFVDKLRDLYKTLITNDKTEKEKIEIKTIWRWIKNLISQMRNYADLVSENDRLKLFERQSRSKEIQKLEIKDKPVKSFSANKINENRKSTPKNKVRSITENSNYKFGLCNMKKNKVNVYESFCKDLMKQHNLKDLAALKAFIDSKNSISQKDKEKINAVRLLLEKSLSNNIKI